MTLMKKSRTGPSPAAKLNATGLLAVVGLVAALFLSVGGVIATIVGNGFNETLGDPGDVGAFTGALIQIVGLLIAVPTGLVAARGRSLSHG
jgi:hypothetical protein